MREKRAEEKKEILTDRQQQVLTFISRSIEERGYPPTLREIGEHMKIRSTNGVNDHLKALERKGYLLREELKSRALRPVGGTGSQAANGASAMRSRNAMVEIPLLGRIAAGRPTLAVENPEDTVRVDKFFLGGAAQKQVFALRVKGDSMIEDGIFDGDFIFVKKQANANRGDVVVALIEDEATVKRYVPDGDSVRLEPANARLQPIIVRKRDAKALSLLGVVVGVYRRL